MAGDDEAAKLQALKDELYEQVTQNGSEARLFTQKDLLDMNVIPGGDVVLLLRVVQLLTNDKLLVGTTNHAGLAWRWRNRDDAKKYTSLPNDETMMVYSVIDEAGADGIWNRTIKNKLNMHEAVVKNCIKYLETKGYIAGMKNVEHPNKKMYIKANLRPSDRATGGPWFTDGELDTAFIAELEELVFNYIKTHSAYLSSQRGGSTPAPRAPKKGVVRGGFPTDGSPPAAARGTKRPATDISKDDVVSPSKPPAAPPSTTAAATTPAAPRSSKSNKTYLPLPAGYKHYPTVSEIARVIDEAGVTNNTTLGEADIQQLVDVLTYDGLIEPVRVGGRKGYRVRRAHKQDTTPFGKQRGGSSSTGGDVANLPAMALLGVPPAPNGLTEAPCGRCPVFDLCEEGGPVSPSNCVYFDQWLGIEDATAVAGGAATAEQVGDPSAAAGKTNGVAVRS